MVVAGTVLVFINIMVCGDGGGRNCTRIHELNDVCGVIVAGTVLVFINIMVWGDGVRHCTRIHKHNGVW